MSEAEFNALAPAEQTTRCEQARTTLVSAGAHLVIDGIWELPAAIDMINARLRQGERP